MNADQVDKLFNGTVLKALVVIVLFAITQVAGHLAAKRLASTRHARQAVGQLLALALFIALMYLLLLGRNAIV
jgi:hypothetical protein